MFLNCTAGNTKFSVYVFDNTGLKQMQKCLKSFSFFTERPSGLKCDEKKN